MSLDQEIHIKQMKKELFKQIVKERMIKHMYTEMEILTNNHSKVKDIVHTLSGKPQQYMSTNIITGKASSLLLNFRSKCGGSKITLRDSTQTTCVHCAGVIMTHKNLH